MKRRENEVSFETVSKCNMEHWWLFPCSISRTSYPTCTSFSALSFSLPITSSKTLLILLIQFFFELLVFTFDCCLVITHPCFKNIKTWLVSGVWSRQGWRQVFGSWEAPSFYSRVGYGEGCEVVLILALGKAGREEEDCTVVVLDGVFRRILTYFPDRTVRYWHVWVEFGNNNIE